MYLVGQGVGHTAVNLLFGDANPSGKLAATFPLKLADKPSYLNFPGDGKTVSIARAYLSDIATMIKIRRACFFVRARLIIDCV